MNKIFYSKCLYPTATITKGKEYVVEEDDGQKLTIVNDSGNKISLMKYRFGEIQVKDSDPKKIKNKVVCINANKFKSITQGISYDLSRESRDFYYIRNNLGVVQRYGKKYFEETPKASVKRVPKKEVAMCVYPVLSELTFKQAYDFKLDKKDKDSIIVTNDGGTAKTYLKKRFNIDMQ